METGRSLSAAGSQDMEHMALRDPRDVEIHWSWREGGSMSGGVTITGFQLVVFVFVYAEFL